MRALLFALLATTTVPAWSVTDVGAPAGHPDAFMIAKAIAEDGSAVGDAWFGPAGSQHSEGFVWRSGRMRILGYPGSTWVETQAVNARGDVVGDAAMGANRGQVALIWSANGGAARVLGSLGGSDTIPVAINAAGAVAGDSQTADGTRHAFVWQSGRMTDLGTLGGAESHAVAINAQGQVIGTSDTATATRRAFLWDNGVMKQLPTIGSYDTSATAINDLGEVVGLVQKHDGQSVEAVAWKRGRLVKLRSQARAISVNRAGDVLIEVDKKGWDAQGAELYSHTGRLWTIPGLGGSPPPNQGAPIIVVGLNDIGQVFGFGYTKKGTGRRTFVWQNGKTTVLPTFDGLDPPWGSPVRINSRGVIVGTAYVSRGGKNFQRVVVWTPL